MGSLNQYLGARILDTSRTSCVLMLVIFVILLVWFVLAFLFILLKPFITSINVGCKDCCKGAKGISSDIDFGEGRDRTKGLNILFSYRLEMNPRYSALLALRGNSEQEVEN